MLSVRIQLRLAHWADWQRLTGEARLSGHLARHPPLSLEKQKPLPKQGLFFTVSSLTMSYFHTGIRTIIGAESFHCPVRDGKEWDQLAMVIRLKPVTAPGPCLVQSIRRVYVISFN